MAGAPAVAALSNCTAPVHINVGGTKYTSSLETLTRFPHSKLAKYFNGSLPIVVDPVQQQYFFDRDGKTFRHVLNFLRNSKLILPDNFGELNLLLEEAVHFEIEDLRQSIQQFLDEKAEGSEETEDSSSSEEDNMNQSAKKRKKKRTKKKQHPEKKTDENNQDTTGEISAKGQGHEEPIKLGKDNKGSGGQSHEGVSGKEKSKQTDSEKNGEAKGKEDKTNVADGGKLTITESVGGNDIVCVLTDKRGGVEEVWCSDKNFIFEHLRDSPEKYNNTNLYDLFVPKGDMCSGCKISLIDGNKGVILSRTQCAFTACNLFCGICAHSRARYMALNQIISDSTWYIPFYCKIGFSEVAKFLLSIRYKLVTTSVNKETIYHYFEN